MRKSVTITKQLPNDSDVFGKYAGAKVRVVRTYKTCGGEEISSVRLVGRVAPKFAFPDGTFDVRTLALS